MLLRKYEFENGCARPMNRGVILWNGSEDEVSRDNPMRSIKDLIYELIGADEVWSEGYDLKGVKITVEIEEVTKQ